MSGMQVDFFFLFFFFIFFSFFFLVGFLFVVNKRNFYLFIYSFYLPQAKANPKSIQKDWLWSGTLVHLVGNVEGWGSPMCTSRDLTWGENSQWFELYDVNYYIMLYVIITLVAICYIRGNTIRLSQINEEWILMELSKVQQW